MSEMSNLQKLSQSQKVFVITGASGGIGLALATKLAKKHIVYSLSRKAQAHESIHFIECDLSQKIQINQALEEIYQKHQRIDGVINNSGYALTGNLAAFSDYQIYQQFAVNLFGAMHVNQAALSYLNPTNSFIINVASIVSVFAIPYFTVYSATKAALLAYAHTLKQATKLTHPKLRIHNFLFGPVKSGFQKNKQAYFVEDAESSNKAKLLLDKIATNSAKSGLSVDHAARAIYQVIVKPTPVTNIAPGFKNNLLYQLQKLYHNDLTPHYHLLKYWKLIK